MAGSPRHVRRPRNQCGNAVSGTKATITVAAVPATLLLLISILVLGGGATQQASASLTSVPGHTQLNEQAVPEWARPILRRAATTCPQITAPLLAAQIETESDWNPNAYNEASHATGLAQFLPTTWTTWGRDGNGDGTADPRNPTDAIISQAAYMCHLASMIKGMPDLHGELTDLALAAYNAGPGNVHKYGGIPPFPETTNYVTKIRTLANSKYAAVPSSTDDPAYAAAVIRKAVEHVNKTMYAWGGGTLNGPSEGTGIDQGIVGFDCSALVRYAYYQGTGYNVNLPRTAEEQYNVTKSRMVAVRDLKPGDLLFWGADHIHHVALYIGNGRMIEAPQSGTRITETTIRTGSDFAGSTRPLGQRQ